MDVRIEKIEPIRVACVRHTGPYEECAGAWNKLCGWAGPRGLFGPQTRMIGISYDDPRRRRSATMPASPWMMTCSRKAKWRAG